MGNQRRQRDPQVADREAERCGDSAIAGAAIDSLDHGGFKRRQRRRAIPTPGDEDGGGGEQVLIGGAHHRDLAMIFLTAV